MLNALHMRNTPYIHLHVMIIFPNNEYVTELQPILFLLPYMATYTIMRFITSCLRYPGVKGGAPYVGFGTVCYESHYGAKTHNGRIIGKHRLPYCITVCYHIRVALCSDTSN